MEHEILQNITEINSRIEESCKKYGRERGEVKLLLATKTVPVEKIKIALKAGHTLIGENKVQEVKEKYEGLSEIPHESHFIGHLQTNKIKEILKYGISCIQSLDRLDLAIKLNDRLVFENKIIDVLIQVNTSNEDSKFGIAPEELVPLVVAISKLERIQIRGLMTIGLFSTDHEKVRECFQLLRTLKEEVEELQIPGVEMRELSMGMSGDLEIAIEEGATIVRVGTAIFGKRVYPDSYYWNENN